MGGNSTFATKNVNLEELEPRKILHAMVEKYLPPENAQTFPGLDLLGL